MKQGREEEAKECFKVFDKKDRSIVSMLEIKQVLTEAVNSQINDDDVREFMKEIDPNNNGHIQQRDFIKLYLS